LTPASSSRCCFFLSPNRASQFSTPPRPCFPARLQQQVNPAPGRRTPPPCHLLARVASQQLPPDSPEPLHSFAYDLFGFCSSQSHAPAARLFPSLGAAPSSIADSSNMTVWGAADSRLAPLGESCAEPQLAQIAADLHSFLFCLSSVRLNVQKNCGFSFFSPTCSFCPRWPFDSFLLMRLATVGRSSATLHIATSQL
jgi:hypothetical protein